MGWLVQIPKKCNFSKLEISLWTFLIELCKGTSENDVVQWLVAKNSNRTTDLEPGHLLSCLLDLIHGKLCRMTMTLRFKLYNILEGTGGSLGNSGK